MTIKPMRIAFVTYQELLQGTDSDQLVAELLRKEGITVDFVAWDGGDVSSYDLTVIRSTWNYHQRYTDFLHWLDDLEQKQIRVLNPVETLRWNTRKDYLLEFENRGVEIVPTVYARCGEKINLHHLMNGRNWDKAVVKPAVSAGAFETWITDGIDQTRFDTLLNTMDLLIQPLMPEIEIGEWSLLFFNRKFSHAVLKRPASGDFRVQTYYGGASELIEAPHSLIAQAQRIVDAVEGDLLYARVDGVVRDNRLLLMELELVEPHLFLDDYPEAVAHFASAIKSV